MSEDGKVVYLLWGYIDSGLLMSEFLVYFMSYIVRFFVDLENCVVMYCYVIYLFVMIFIYELME